jgi:hypothetical protein
VARSCRERADAAGRREEGDASAGGVAVGVVAADRACTQVAIVFGERR